MWYGLDRTNSIPTRYFAAIARTLELLPAKISRDCARDSPLLYTASIRSDDPDELLAVAWPDFKERSKVCFVFTYYGKNGFRPIEKKKLKSESLDFDPIRSKIDEFGFLDPDSRLVLTLEEFFLFPELEPSENQSDRSETRSVTQSPAPPSPRDAAGIVRVLKDALRKVREDPDLPSLVSGSLKTALAVVDSRSLATAGPDSTAPAERPAPRKIYPGADQEAYQSFRNVIAAYTKSLFLPDTNEGLDETLTVMNTTLPFCPGPGLFEVTRDHLSGFVVLTSYNLHDHPVFLTAKSGPIHNYLIEPKKLRITNTTVVQYLRFFCRFVQGDQGGFPIIARARDLDWRFETEDVKEAVDQQLFPVTLLPDLKAEEVAQADDMERYPRRLASEKYRDDERSVYSLAACVSFGRALSLAWFLVFPDGEVTMNGDWPLVSELPVYPQMLTHEENFVFERDRCSTFART